MNTQRLYKHYKLHKKREPVFPGVLPALMLLTLWFVFPVFYAHALTIESVSPLANATKVATSANAEITLSEETEAADETMFAIHGTVSGSHEFSVSISKNKVILNPAGNFVSGETVAVSAAIPGADPLVWQFFIAGSQKTNPYFFDSGNTFGSGGNDLALGDFNGDNALDIFWGKSGTAELWLNDGKGKFSGTGSLGSASINEIALGDLNRDGFPDVFAANSGGNKVWLNNGNDPPVFSEISLGDSETSNGVALADLDGDGDLDAFTANSGADRVWFNDGTGNFPIAQSLTLEDSDTGNSAVLGDFDGDGDLDAFVVNSGADKIYWNDGSGNFSVDQSLSLGDSASGNAAAVCDLNADGYLDVAVANSGANKIWLNDGSGNFPQSVTLAGSDNSSDVAVADIDGDGTPDLVVSNSSGSAKIWLNDGKGGFAAGTKGIPNAVGNTIGIGDVNGDNFLDVVMAGASGNKIWQNNRPPKITQGGSATVYMDQNGIPKDFSLTLTGSDPDENALSWRISKAAANGNAGISPAGVVSYAVNADYTGKDTFEIELSDGLDTAAITVNVNIGEGLPIIEPDEDSVIVQMNEGQDDFSLSLSAENPSKPDDILTWSITESPRNGEAVIVGSSAGKSIDLDYTPAEENFWGTDDFTVQVSTSKGSTDEIVVYVEVIEKNDPPVITEQKNTSLSTIKMTPLTIRLNDLSVTDPDNFYPGDFFLTIQDGENYTHSGNTVTPVSGFEGTLSVFVTVSDGRDESNVFALSVEVYPPGVGDIDGDGNVSLEDVMLLLKLLAGEDSTAQLDADMDGDGKLTMQDVVILMALIHSSDVDGDGKVKLTDAILVFKIVTGIDLGGRPINLGADVNGDGRIGTEEAVFILNALGEN